MEQMIMRAPFRSGVVTIKQDLKGLPADLARTIERAINDIDNASILVAADQITPDEWQREMETAIARFHETAAMVGKQSSDVAELQPTIDRLVAIQFAFLENFADDIRGEGWLDRYAARAQMYGSAIKQAYWHGDVIRQTGRVLPLPAMPAEGTQCLSNCKCRWRVETLDDANGDYDAFWERHVEDSCQTCLEREASWSPVQIRGGELIV
jgi:hypothetical protein